MLPPVASVAKVGHLVCLVLPAGVPGGDGRAEGDNVGHPLSLWP